MMASMKALYLLLMSHVSARMRMLLTSNFFLKKKNSLLFNLTINLLAYNEEEE
jgi:hypothetical protein